MRPLQPTHKLLLARGMLSACAGVFASSSARAAQESQAALDTTGVRAAFRLLDLPAPWILVLLVLPFCALIAWIGYWRQAAPLRARILMASLRFLALCAALAVVFRPVFVERREEIKQAEVLILVDDSASMRRKDGYGGDEDSRRALERLAGAGNVADQSRSELMRAGLERVLLPRLNEKQYGTRIYRFADTLEPLASLDDLGARGHATHVGDALTAALAAHRGRHVTDVVILSDGRSNGGLSAPEAARAAGAAGVPVHTVVIGDTRPERNLVIEIAEAPGDVLEGDEIAVSARLSGRGTSGVGSARVLLEELSDGSDQARALDEEEAPVNEAGTRIVLVAPPDDRAAARGERRFRLSVPPLPDETLRDDNAVEFSVRVRPEKIRVLYVDGYPRWEYRYLKNLLLRSDQNVEVQCYLLSATRDFLQESTRGLPSLTEVPTDRKELLENYDVVILGDVDPQKISADPEKNERFVASLREFVERGGGLIFQAGESDNPRSYVITGLNELLPVVVDVNYAASYLLDTSEEFKPKLEEPAAPHEIVRLGGDPEQNRALWEDEGGLRGFFWFYPIARAKPGAQVLLRHPTAVNQHGALPLLVAGYFPSGRTLFAAFDSTWGWRYRFGDRYHERFWRNAIRWVALGRLKSGDRRVQIDALRTSYDLDERVTIEARALDEDFRPSEKPTLEARLEGPDRTPSDLKLSLVPDRAGLYRVSFDVERPGVYRAFVESNGARVASTEFEVVLPSRENADPAPDPAALASISGVTGGRALTLADLRVLLDEFPGGEERREPISSELEDAWDRLATLLLVLGLVSVEFLLRKRWELV